MIRRTLVVGLALLALAPEALAQEVLPPENLTPAAVVPAALVPVAEEPFDAAELVRRAEDALRGETAEMRMAMT
ncbi:MAG: hypothetical protein V3V67_19210, partial [Myxococcota bacterium]